MLNPRKKNHQTLLMAGILALFLLVPVRPARAQFGVFIGAPTFAFSLFGGVNVFWMPSFATYTYYGNGYYYRWYQGGWLYAPVYYGPWAPLPPWFVLPQVLLYGPPPPVIAYRPYFMWWRGYVGPWYEMHHPYWWGRYHPYLDHFDDWRQRAVPRFRNHPDFWEHRGGPRMHPIFAPAHPNYRRSFIASHPNIRQRFNQYRARQGGGYPPHPHFYGPLRHGPFQPMAPGRPPMRGGPGQFRGGPGQFRGGPGQFRGGPGQFRGGPGQFRGGPGQFRGGPGRFRGGPMRGAGGHGGGHIPHQS